jgi:hypothetical protein
MGCVVVVRLLFLFLFLELDVSRMLRHRQAESAMMTPGLWRATGFVAHMLVLLSRIAGPEQQPKPEQKSFNHSGCKRIKETCMSVTHCNHIDDTRTACALREINFLVSVGMRTEE